MRSYRARLGLADETCYANSGVLVIDPERWTQQGLTERVIRYLGDHLDDCYWVDQDALNAVVRGDFQKLSPVWNIGDPLVPLRHRRDDRARRSALCGYEQAVAAADVALRPHRHRALPRILRPTPWPDAVRWSGSPAEWAMYLRFRQRAALRWLRRRPALKPLPPETIAAFRRQLATLPFGDIRQGLAVWQPDGSLRAP